MTIAIEVKGLVKVYAGKVRAIFQVLIIIPVALLIGVDFLFNPLYFIMAILIKARHLSCRFSLSVIHYIRYI